MKTLKYVNENFMNNWKPLVSLLFSLTLSLSHSRVNLTEWRAKTFITFFFSELHFNHSSNIAQRL